MDARAMITNPVPSRRAISHLVNVEAVLLRGEPFIETYRAESYCFLDGTLF